MVAFLVPLSSGRWLFVWLRAGPFLFWPWGSPLGFSPGGSGSGCARFPGPAWPPAGVRVCVFFVVSFPSGSFSFSVRLFWFLYFLD